MKILRWILGVSMAVVLVALGIGLYLSATGKSAWEAWKAERRAKGEVFEWAPLLPPPVKDEDNFALAPNVVGAVKGDEAAKPWFGIPEVTLPKEDKDWKDGVAVDLGTPEMQALLARMKEFKPGLDALVEASKRPGCRLPVDYEAGEAPMLLGFRHTSRLLRLRAVADIRKGRRVEAFEDVMGMVRIPAHFQREPGLLPFLQQVGLAKISMQPIWEGVVTRIWDDAQLSRLETELNKLDLLDSWLRSAQAERLYMVASLASLAEKDPNLMPRESRNPENDRQMEELRGKPIPMGWVYRNILTMEKVRAMASFDRVHLDARTVSPGPLLRPITDWVKRTPTTPFNVMAKIVLPAFEEQLIHMARLQSRIDQARIAIALERHRLAHGEYPSTLAEIAPSFLAKVPHDLIGGAPYRYARTEEGGFRLYGLGWDAKDDGGVPAPEAIPEGEQPWRGDWVWPRRTDFSGVR